MEEREGLVLPPGFETLGRGTHRMAFPYYLAINNRKSPFGFHFDSAPPVRLTSIPASQIMDAMSPVISGQWEMVTGFWLWVQPAGFSLR